MKSRCLDDKVAAKKTIMVLEANDRCSGSHEITSVTSNLPEDQSNLVLTANESCKAHYYHLSVGKRIVQVNLESFEDVKELKMILRELCRRTEELYKHVTEQTNEIQQQLSNVSTRSENIQNAFM